MFDNYQFDATRVDRLNVSNASTGLELQMINDMKNVQFRYAFWVSNIPLGAPSYWTEVTSTVLHSDILTTITIEWIDYM